jgi:hypothetical protein
MDKRSSLLQKFVNYGEKKFYNIGPRLGLVALHLLNHVRNAAANVGQPGSYGRSCCRCRSRRKRTSGTQEHTLHPHLPNGTAHFKSVNNCLINNIYSYLETSGGKSSNPYLNVVQFFDTSVN